MGELASIGNVPKLLMGVLASAMGLLIQQGRWFWAGAAGMLCFLDWQVGALAWLAALAAALLLRGPRLRAVPLVALGGAAALVPFALYFAAHGALAETVRQVVVESFLRGADPDVVESERERRAETARELDLLEKNLAGLR